MKKSIFYSAFLMLLVANVFVYSCQKDNTVTTAPAVTNEQAVVDRNANCPQITITGGAGLGICGVDVGSGSCASSCPATPVMNAIFDFVSASPQNFPFANGNVFTLYNPTANAMPVSINFNCGAVQAFLIPALSSRSFRVATNITTGCCQAVSPC